MLQNMSAQKKYICTALAATADCAKLYKLIRIKTYGVVPSNYITALRTKLGNLYLKDFEQTEWYIDKFKEGLREIAEHTKYLKENVQEIHNTVVPLTTLMKVRMFFMNISNLFQANQNGRKVFTIFLFMNGLEI